MGVPPGSEWLSRPEDVYRAIEHCNRNWRERLSYEDFELEPEEHAAMLFVKHKNYLIWDAVDGEMKLTTKGNNFKGSDKANIAEKFLKQIMNSVVEENVEWDDPEQARENLKLSIKRNAAGALDELRLEDVDMDDFTLVQVVRPHDYYKPIEIRTNARRATPRDTSSPGISGDMEAAAGASKTADVNVNWSACWVSQSGRLSR